MNELNHSYGAGKTIARVAVIEAYKNEIPKAPEQAQTKADVLERLNITPINWNILHYMETDENWKAVDHPDDETD